MAEATSEPAAKREDPERLTTEKATSCQPPKCRTMAEYRAEIARRRESQRENKSSP
jgi:hypothetical protein